MGFLQVAFCPTPFPQWECFLPAAERSCANSGDIQVFGARALPTPMWEGPAQYEADNEMNSWKKKQKHLYNPRGYVLGAGCNCFPHFLRPVKLIHYQRKAVMP